jgi:hypothetical protein
MALETLVKAIDLTQWANRLEARGTLPLLIRRLIHASIDDIQHIGFPADEGIQTPSYDGFLVVKKGNAFVPDGCSVWEMGVNHDIKGKADSDYEKRCNEHLDIDPAATTFVFVTPRRWQNKITWIEEKKKHGFWKDVRVIDADEMEQWLELTPSVHIWISILLGKHPKTAEDISSFWEYWSSTTKPALIPQLLIIGREIIIGRVEEWLRSEASVLVLKADTQQESLAFFGAMLFQKSADERIMWLSRVIVVNDLETLNQLIVSQTKLILIPTFNPNVNVGRAIQNGHHVLVPVGKDSSISKSTVEINRQHVDQITEVLVKMQVKEDRARSLAAMARRSLMAFRRTIAINPELLLPTWANPEHAREIVPALLLGQWDETKKGDQTTLPRLVNMPYEDVIGTISRWANDADPPIRHVGNIWLLSSKGDAWSLISRYINSDDLSKFESLTLEVLGEVNPRLELPINERWMAALHGKVLNFSDNLREGISETLAIMGAKSAETEWTASVSPQVYVNRIIHELLDRANKDWRIWSSLSPVLRLLSEASPDQFLNAIGEELSKSNPELINVFEEPESVLFSGATYPGLLSSIELLAWNSDYLPLATLNLAILTRIDPGGKLGNRPSNSLKEIFLIWNPQTTATLEQRLRVVDMLRGRESSIAWKLMIDILPEPHAISTPSPTPRWRDWIPDNYPTVTYGEILEATNEIVKRLIQDLGNDGKRWSTLIEHLASLSKDAVNIVIEQIEKLDIKKLTPEDCAIIWASLRRLVARHKRFPEAAWAMPGDVIKRLNLIYERFTPNDLIPRYAWLFGNHVEMIGDFGKDWKAHEQAVASTKIQAAKEILVKGGIQMLLDLVANVEQPYFLGLTIGQIEFSSQDEDTLLSCLNSQHNYHKTFMAGFVLMRHKNLGWDWVQTKTKVLQSNFTHEQQSEFLIYLPFTTKTWQIVESFGSDVLGKYWSSVRSNGFETDDFNFAIQNLLDYKRPYVALELISMHIDLIGIQISPKLVADCLEMAVRTKPDYEGEMRVFDFIDDILNSIEKTREVDESRLASIEFSLLPILNHHGERGPRHLHKELSRNPEFFAEVICLVYRAEDDEKQEISDDRRIQAQLAHELLYGWKLIPGTDDNGLVNPKLLSDWIQETRKKAIQNKRLKIVDLTIGNILSHSPHESDGTWPAAFTREIIENINSDAINRGFIMGVIKNRGVTSRGLLDGGMQERELAKQFKGYATAIRDQWPRTASVLDQISHDYLSDARREDIGAELEEDLWYL